MKKLFSILLVGCMIFMSACSIATQNVTTPATESIGVDDATDPIPETSEVILSEEEIYHNFLSKLHKKLNAIVGDDTHLDGFGSQGGMVGVAEIAWADRLNVLKLVGYTMMDITKDGIPELLICAVDEQTDAHCKGARILEVFTVSKNDVKPLYGGTELNRHYLLEDGTLYNEISNGVETVIAGIYQPVEGETAFSCADFYFVEFDENNQPHFYHNQSEKQDASVSEPLDGETFGKIVDGFTARIQMLDLTPMEMFED